MKIEKLLLNYVNNREQHERQVGRYWATDLWAIINDRITPEEFFSHRKIDLNGCKNIVEGESKELLLKDIFDHNGLKYDYQPKVIVPIDDEIELVVVADFLFPEYVLECKSPLRMENLPKEYHFPQLEAQYRAFKRPVYVIYLKERMEYKIFRYKPNDALHNQIIQKLKEFHQKVKEYDLHTRTT